MVEGAPLLREYTGDRIEGSNPFLSASRFFTMRYGNTISLRAGNLSFGMGVDRHHFAANVVVES